MSATPSLAVARLRAATHKAQLIVADQGIGRPAPRSGFGTRMMDALVGQLQGTLEYEDAGRERGRPLTLLAAAARAR